MTENLKKQLDAIRIKLREYEDSLEKPKGPRGGAIAPCPFCGSLPQWWGEMTGHNNFHLRCNCHAHPEVHATTPQEAIQMWNTRSAD